MKTRKNRTYRPLPGFDWQLRLRRQEIARALALDLTDEAAARELDAALDDLAYWLKRSWLLLRHADRSASILAQRNILAELVAKPVESLAALHSLTEVNWMQMSFVC